MEAALPRKGVLNPLGPSLGWALSRILPGQEETWLLRALLHRGPEAREAWDAFSSRIPDLPSLFRTDTGGRKRLSPLLLASIRENDIPADPALLTVLKTAYLREDLRVDAYRNIALSALSRLQGAEVPFLVLKGAALAETVYSDACLRHAHDVDLLVAEEDQRRALEVLLQGELRPDHSLPNGRGTVLKHPSDTPFLLLTRLFRHPFYLSDLQALRDRSRSVATPGLGTVPVLSAEDNLTHALGHASYCPSRSTLQWVTDAWMILNTHEGIDWDRFLESVAESRLELPVYMMLEYLKEELDAPVPRYAVESSGRQAAMAGKLKRDVALYGARAHRGRHPQLSGLREPGWRDRLDLLRWQLFPSREYLSWAYDHPSSLLLTAIYLMRPFTYGAEALKWWVLRRWRSWAGA